MKRWLDRLVVILLGAVAGSALAFNLDSQGRVHRLAAYKGKWVLENCWASWCPHCLEEIPELDALQEAPKRNLRVIGIAVDYPRQVLEFAEQMMVSDPIILGSHALANQIGPVRGLSSTYLYDPQGRLVTAHMGPLTRADVERFIRKQAVKR